MIRLLICIGLLVFLTVVAGLRSAILLSLGLAFGFALERFGFGFAGPWRRFIKQRDGRGVTAQIIAIGLAAVVIQPIIAYAPGNFVGAIAPVSITMLLGAFVFGIAMQIILGCGSGTLVNAGSGNLTAIIALPIFCIGSFVGTLFVPEVATLTPHITVNFNQVFGVLGSIILTCVGLGIVLTVLMKFSAGPLVSKQLTIVAAIIAILAIVHVLVAGQPWGVVYGLGLWIAKAAVGLGWDPNQAVFWVQAVNQTALNNSILLDTTSLTNIGLIGGASFAAWRSSAETALKIEPTLWIYMVIIGAAFMLGVSSRFAFGCNIGGLFSGIASGSLHGWVWLIAAFAGSLIGVKWRDNLCEKALRGAS